MDLTNPMQSVIPSAHGAVLSVLARTDEPLSGHRVAELTRPRFAQTRSERRSSETGRVRHCASRKQAPRQPVPAQQEPVLLPGESWRSPACGPLFCRASAPSSRTGLRRRRPHGCSAPRHGEKQQLTATSIFLLLRLLVPWKSEETFPVWQLQTDALAENIRAWTGNSCEVLEMDATELDAAVDRDDRLVRDLRDQAIVLAGADTQILRRRKVSG